MKEPIITSDPAIFGGKPIVGGTRVAVSTILDMLATGLSVDEVLKEYPTLTKKEVQEAIAFASARVRREMILPIATKNGGFAFPTL